MNNFATDMFIAGFNRAARAVFEVDPDGKEQFARLQGKVFCVELTAPPLRIFLFPGADGVVARGHSDRDADVTISGSVVAFAQLAGGGRRLHNLTIHGDAELAQQMQKILRRLDLDWEELLARRIGDAPARTLSGAARGLADYAADTAALARENVADYLREEKPIAVATETLEEFARQINDLRAATDRLAQRIARLRSSPAADKI